ncbi:MAG: YbaB/EbfC family nucleoid-associated protein, partial [Clostridia bacterium]|nr:YbaB/EbfC family nucleoid-associated protein [Clostridia bacterium]
SAVKIKPEAVDPDDIEMLEDLIVASFNDATAKAEEIREQKLGKFAGLGV